MEKIKIVDKILPFYLNQVMDLSQFQHEHNSIFL